MKQNLCKQNLCKQNLYTQEYYQKVAFIAFDNPDGSLIINIPLYVKVSELNKNGMTDGQEALIHRVSEIMLRRYERQISDFMSKQKMVVNQRVINSRNCQSEGYKPNSCQVKGCQPKGAGGDESHGERQYGK